jgi:hypothetical protein
MTTQEIKLSEMAAENTLERIGLTRDKVRSIVASIPVAARCHNAEKAASAVRSAQYVLSLQNDPKAPLNECLEFYDQVTKSSAFVNRISLNSGFHECFLRDKIRRRKQVRVSELKKLKEVFSKPESTRLPVVIKILNYMQTGKIYQALPIADALKVDTQHVKNALCDLCRQKKITRTAKGSYVKN